MLFVINCLFVCFSRSNCDDAVSKVKALLATAGFSAELNRADVAKGRGKDASDAASVASLASAASEQKAGEAPQVSSGGRYMSVYTSVYIYIYIYICMCMYICMYTYVCLYV